jgi:crotonobetainyl-CoA:carnitine CoA-transferase CaiB-like acyl-CoA transferase
MPSGNRPQPTIQPMRPTPCAKADRNAIVAHIAPILRTRPRDEWLELFTAARVPAGPIYRLDEIASDPDLRDRGFLYAFARNGVQVPQVGLGITFDGQEARTAPPPAAP